MGEKFSFSPFYCLGFGIYFLFSISEMIMAAFLASSGFLIFSDNSFFILSISAFWIILSASGVDFFGCGAGEQVGFFRAPIKFTQPLQAFFHSVVKLLTYDLQ